MKHLLLFTAIFLGFSSSGFSQKLDSVKHYFIITAGTTINAYYNDKPLELETITDFNDYIQKNAKILKESWVVVTGKPKEGTFDDVIKTLSHYRFKHVTKNIIANCYDEVFNIGDTSYSSPSNFKSYSITGKSCNTCFFPRNPTFLNF